MAAILVKAMGIISNRQLDSPVGREMNSWQNEEGNGRHRLCCRHWIGTDKVTKIVEVEEIEYGQNAQVCHGQNKRFSNNQWAKALGRSHVSVVRLGPSSGEPQLKPIKAEAKSPQNSLQQFNPI